MIRTPDQRLRVFVSSTLAELADERRAVRRAVEALRLTPVMFEIGARPHPPRELYRAYLAQSDVFVGVYWERYGWVAPGEEVSGLENEYRLSAELPQLVYIKEPAPGRERRLAGLLDVVKSGDQTSYRRFSTATELEELVAEDLAVLLSERFAAGRGAGPRLGGGRSQPPVPLTRTVGRTAEVDGIVGLLADGARLVTLTGVGGVGKTRTALEVARQVGDRFGQVHFVPLADVPSAELVLPTVADRLAVRDAATTPALEALVEHFGHEEGLLVLDNVEQVVDARRDVGQLLEQASGLRVLTTSRQALRLSGEQEVQLTPLEVPPDTSRPGEVGDSAAVRLFVDRARSFGVPLEVTEGNAGDLAELCRALGGLPLAIELAAARVRLLGARGLLERLGSVLDLHSASVGVPVRQQTLRTTLDWSHETLDEAEQRVFRRLSVFRGGAALDAVEAVCGEPGDGVLDALAGLLDKNVVALGDVHQGGEPRVQLLEPVREYAGERLDESGETPAIRRRHLEHLSRLGRRAQPFLCGPHQQEWAERFDRERANMRAAVTAGFDAGAFTTVLRLVWDTFVYYYVRDSVDESRGWVQRLAEGRDRLGHTDRALLDLCLVIGGHTPGGGDAAEVLGGVVRTFRGGGLALERAVSLNYLGLHHWYDGDPARAAELLRAASREYTAIDHDWGIANVEMTLGALALGRPTEAEQHYIRSLEHSRRIDNRPQVAQGLVGLAVAQVGGGRAADAVETLVPAARIVLADRSRTGASYCLEALAGVAVEHGDLEGAARMVGVARAVRHRLSVPDWPGAAGALGPTVESLADDLPPERLRALAEECASLDVFELLEHSLDLASGPS